MEPLCVHVTCFEQDTNRFSFQLDFRTIIQLRTIDSPHASIKNCAANIAPIRLTRKKKLENGVTLSLHHRMR